MDPDVAGAPGWVRRYWNPYAGFALTLVAIALAEVVAHFTAAPTALGAGLMLLGLVGIAYAALKAGAWAGVFGSLVLAAYALHYTSPHDAVVALEPRTWLAGGVVLALGLAMTWPMSRIRRREEALRVALERRAREAEARNRELTEANAALEAFGYVVSHDLKEPVRALENYLHAAIEEWPNDESREYLEEAYDANARLARMLHGLLEYSRTSSAAASPRPIGVKDAIASETCRAQYAAKLRERRGTLEVDDDAGTVMADEIVLCQLFGNLVLNAVRHHPRERPTVRVRRLPSEPGRVHVVVEDDGRGFPPDVLRNFARLDGGKPGTIKGGFGLAIAHRAAQRLGGRAWLENRPGGEGARVHVELPEAPPASGEGSAAPAGTGLAPRAE